jgi:hypothetical protein
MLTITDAVIKKKCLHWNADRLISTRRDGRHFQRKFNRATASSEGATTAHIELHIQHKDVFR